MEDKCGALALLCVSDNMQAQPFFKGDINKLKWSEGTNRDDKVTQNQVRLKAVERTKKRVDSRVQKKVVFFEYLMFCHVNEHFLYDCNRKN